MGIGAADLAIVAIYLLGMVALGVWLGRGTRNAADYLLGSRDLPWPALLISIVATETKFILVEGNYLLLDEEPWSRLAPLFDFSSFVDVPPASGPGPFVFKSRARRAPNVFRTLTTDSPVIVRL